MAAAAAAVVAAKARQGKARQGKARDDGTEHNTTPRGRNGRRYNGGSPVYIASLTLALRDVPLETQQSARPRPANEESGTDGEDDPAADQVQSNSRSDRIEYWPTWKEDQLPSRDSEAGSWLELRPPYRRRAPREPS